MMETLAREQMMDVVGPGDRARSRSSSAGATWSSASDLPYTTAAGLVYDSVSAAGDLEQAAEMIGYDTFRDEQATAREEGRLVGIGLGLYVEPSGLAIGSLSSEGAPRQRQPERSGAGRDEQRQPRPERRDDDRPGGGRPARRRLRRRHGRPGRHRGGPVRSRDGRQPQRGAVQRRGPGGGRCEVRGKIIEIAAHALEAAPEDLEISGGRVSVVGTPARGVGLADVAQIAYINPAALPPGMEMGLEAQCPLHARRRRSRSPTRATRASARSTRSPARSTLLRYVVSEDCGVMINPTVVEGQIAGGVVQGIGGVLYEHMAYDDDGNPLSHDVRRLPAADGGRGAGHRVRPHRDAGHHQPRWVQGHGRGRRHRLTAGGDQRHRRRARADRGQGQSPTAGSGRHRRGHRCRRRQEQIGG